MRFKARNLNGNARADKNVEQREKHQTEIRFEDRQNAVNSDSKQKKRAVIAARIILLDFACSPHHILLMKIKNKSAWTCGALSFFNFD